MKKVYIIDDESTLSDMLSTYLERNGFATECSDSGEGILAKVRAFMPDIILCDIIMEPVTGLEVYYTLKRNLDTATIPFVFISSKKDKNDIIKGLEVGADDYITKPFALEEVKNRINHLLFKKENKQFARINIVIVDRSNVILKKTENELTKEGYNVLTATSISDVRSLLQTEAVDVVVSGTKLNDGSGYDLCRLVKEKNKQIKFFLLINQGNTEAITKGDEVGVDDFITKNLGVEGIKIKLLRFQRPDEENQKLIYDISEKDILTVLQSCEVKGFTGHIYVEAEGKAGYVQMQSGEYLKMSFDNLSDVDALEAMRNLSTGRIIIKQQKIEI